MKNILLLTTEYPNPDSNFDTPVIHYFTKEWVKMGYKVKVIHYRSVFPIFFYWISSLFTKVVKKIIGTDFVPTKRVKEDKHYVKDNVLIYSFPIFKLIPHGKYQSSTIKKHLQKILNLNKEDGFVPDILIGHFYNPQIEIITNLKKHYPTTKTCIVLHESPEIIKKTYPKKYAFYLSEIDIWGFRFSALKDRFEKTFGTSHKTFICYSGLPEEYIFSENTLKTFNNKVKKFCYVGMLIPLKRVSDIIVALHKSFPQKDFEFNIIGQGMEQENLKKLVQELGLDQNIAFHGRKKREEVQNMMNESDCFVMVSESEAFGLVYLEAMSKGCITIGTRGQGIDGVIVDGENGFLCQSKNSDELAAIITNINSLSNKKLVSISQKAIKTTQAMTDEKVAKDYLNVIINT